MFTNLFEHELPQTPDLLSVLGVIHHVVLHEKGLRGNNMQKIGYTHAPGAEALALSALQWYLDPSWADKVN